MRAKCFFISTSFVLLLFSCERTDIKDEIETFMSAPVVLSLDSMQNVAKMELMDSVLCDYTLVNYIDSTNCTECAITHLTDWKYLREEISEKGLCMSIVFVLSPPDSLINNTRNLLMQNPGQNSQIFIDTFRLLERKNPHLPKSGILHTFLLDRKGNVLLIGNPLKNDKIKELMYKIINEKEKKDEIRC